MRFTPKEIEIIELIGQFGGIDDICHKAWLIDQIVRIIAKEDYQAFVESYENGSDGPKSYPWDTGVAP